MAKIDEINFDELTENASAIALHGDMMQGSIKLAIQEIDNMRNVWFGNSYDLFVANVNLITYGLTGLLTGGNASSQFDSLNVLIKTIVSDIPYELYDKARSYAHTQYKAITASFSDKEPVVLPYLYPTDKGSELRFWSADVETAKTNIYTYLTNASDEISTCKSLAFQCETSWQSISGEININALKNALDRVQEKIDNIRSELNKAITDQANAIEAIEKAAEEIKSFANVVTPGIDSGLENLMGFSQMADEAATKLWKNLTGRN